jgi:hypothetical protein
MVKELEIGRVGFDGEVESEPRIHIAETAVGSKIYLDFRITLNNLGSKGLSAKLHLVLEW